MWSVSSVQSLSHVQLFAIPWTAERQASLSTANSRSLLRFMFIQSVMPSSHFIFCCPFSTCLRSFPALGFFLMSQFFASGGHIPMNIQDWFPLGLTGWISLLSKGLSRVFSNTTVQKHQFLCFQHSLYSNSYIHTWLLEKP